jgi:hypothetical protein
MCRVIGQFYTNPCSVIFLSFIGMVDHLLFQLNLLLTLKRLLDTLDYCLLLIYCEGMNRKKEYSIKPGLNPYKGTHVEGVRPYWS